MHPNTGCFLFEAPLRTLSTHIIMKTKSNIRNRFAQAVMTLLVTLLSTVTAWAQTPIEGLTYNETDGCYDISTLTELQAFISYANSVSDHFQT